MSKIHISRKHELSRSECQALAEQLLEKLAGKFGGSIKPDGDNYKYKHTAGVNALVEPKDGELVVNVKLGLLTRSMAPQLEREMNKVLDEHLPA